ncbi:MAG: helix-turn-helix transcriptional regulator [Ferruginibacter sp.]
MHKSINDDALQKIIGENIEQLRLFKKMPIKEIASALQLSGTAYRNIERGISNSSISKLFEISVLLEINIVQLFEFDINVVRKESKNGKANYPSKQLEENYHQRIQQFKEENSFLKKRIETLESIISSNQVENHFL